MDIRPNPLARLHSHAICKIYTLLKTAGMIIKTALIRIVTEKIEGSDILFSPIKTHTNKFPKLKNQHPMKSARITEISLLSHPKKKGQSGYYYT